jgi:hypothetical protein
LAVFALILGSGLSSCGIPEIVVLEPPEITRVLTIPAAVDFQHSTTNDREDFLGYELYYKFYEPGNADQAFSSDRASLESATPSAAVTTLTSRGYFRVHALSSTGQQPVVPISAAERSSSFVVSVEYPATEFAVESASAVWEAKTQRLARDLSLFTETETFVPADIDLTDPDMPSDTTGATSTLPMGLAIVAYGIDFTNGSLSAIYSEIVVADSLLEVIF